VRSDQNENRLKVPPKPHSQRRHKLGQPIREGDDHPIQSCCEPFLQRLPSGQIDLGTIRLLRKRPEYRRSLVARVSDRQAEHPGLVFGVKAKARRRYDQPGGSLTLNQTRNKSLFGLFDRFVAQTPLGQQRPDQIGRKIRGHSRRLVDHEMAVLQWLAGVGQRPVAHRRERVKSLGREEF
jgi:hypothetical protein